MPAKKIPAKTSDKTVPVKRRKLKRPRRDPFQPRVFRCPKCNAARTLSLLDFFSDVHRCIACFEKFLDTVAPIMLEEEGNNG